MSRPHRLSPAPPATTAFAKCADFLAWFRWAYLPLALLALVAVGVHAAASSVDERLVWLIDRGEAWLDGLVASLGIDGGVFHRIDPSAEVRLARTATLVWELLADALVALPLLGHRVGAAATPLARGSFPASPRWSAARQAVRGLLVAALAFAGAGAIARMVHGAVSLTFRSAFEGMPSGLVAGWLAGLAFVLVLGTLGWRAVHAVVQSRRGGWASLVLLLPLAAAAVRETIAAISLLG